MGFFFVLNLYTCIYIPDESNFNVSKFRLVHVVLSFVSLCHVIVLSFGF